MSSRLEQLRDEVVRFHAAHPEVWALFERFALEKLRQGHRAYSADAIMHRVRWETEAGDGAGEFKINNNLVSLYARRFLRLHPEAGEFFRTRRQTSKDRAA